MASWVEVDREELARLKLERDEYASNCQGVNRDGFRGPLFFDRLAGYDREIARLEALVEKEAA